MRIYPGRRTVTWTIAISASLLAPHAAPIPLGIAVSTEVFELLRSRSYQKSVLAYIRAARPGTYVRIGYSDGTAAAVVMRAVSSGVRPSDHKEGAPSVPSDDARMVYSRDSATDPVRYCIEHRKVWLDYAWTLTRSDKHADDAVEHLTKTILRHYRDHHALGPRNADLPTWTRKVIARYVKETLDPGEFCINQRGDWLGYALALTRDWQDAEDIVSDVAEKVIKCHRTTRTLCPAKFDDPVAWAKTVIANQAIDRHRRAEVRRRYSRAFLPPQEDFAEHVADELIAGKAWRFLASLKPKEHVVAMLAWEEGLQPKEIASRLGMKEVTVRTMLFRIRAKMRKHVGIDSKTSTEETP